MSGKDTRPKKRRKKRKATGIVNYKVAEAASMLRISENAMRDLIKRGECPCTRVGRLMRIPSQQFHDKYGYAVSI